jgi:hypothetical protein
MVRLVIAALWLGGCSGPGGQDPEPIDPHSIDTDGDGLSDGDEADRGTDPAEADSDVDTYSDGHEVLAGTDPLNPKDRIYKGYWPYNPDKDSIVDPGFDREPLEVGDTFGRIVGATDQFGEEVDLYDFVGSNEFIIIDASATWCGVCQETSIWLTGGPDPENYEMLFGPARALVDSGAVRWITFMTDNGTGEACTPENVKAWDEMAPHDRIPVLTDPNGDVLWGLNRGVSYYGNVHWYWPSFVVIDGTTFEVLNRGYAWDAMDFVVANHVEDEEEGS